MNFLKSLRMGVLAAALVTSLGAFGQTKDIGIEIYGSPLPVAGRPVLYTLIASGAPHDSFSAVLTVPPELEVVSTCGPAATFQPATRILRWDDAIHSESYPKEICGITFLVGSNLAPGVSFTLRASVATNPPDANPANDVSTRTDVVLPESEIGVEVKADVQQFRPGTAYGYDITVTNRGPLAAENVRLVDQISADVTYLSFQQTSGVSAAYGLHEISTIGCYHPRCGTYIEASIPFLPANGIVTFRLVVQAKTTFEAADIENRAFVSSSSIDFNDRNDQATVRTYAGPEADLSVATAVGLETAAGIPVTLTIGNEGPDTVKNVSIEEELFDMTGTLYDLSRSVKIEQVQPSQGTCAAPVLTQYPGSPNPPPNWRLECALGQLASGATATIHLTIHRLQPVGRAMRLTSYVKPGQNDRDGSDNWNEILLPSLGKRRVSGR